MALTRRKYGIQCFLTEKGRFLNRFLRAMTPSFLVLGDNCCTFAEKSKIEDFGENENNKEYIFKKICIEEDSIDCCNRHDSGSE